MTCQTCQDRLADFVSGETPLDAEAAAHLATCIECKAELAALQEAYHAMAFAAPAAPVPTGLKAKLMSRVDATLAPPPMRVRTADESPQASPEHWLSRGFKLFVTSAVAAGVAVVITHAVMMGRVRELQRMNDQIGSALDFSQKQNVALQENMNRHGNDLKVLQAADLRVVNLTAPPKEVGGQCRLFFAPGNDAGYFVVRDAPPPPPGREYELWLIDGASKKTAAGTFNVSHDGSARVPVKFDAATASGAAVVAVTDEPPGGVPQPTGSVRFVGKVQ